MSDEDVDLNLVEMTAEIVSAYVRNNSVPAGDLPQLLHSIHTSLGSIVAGPAPEPVKEPPQPKVSVKKSVTDDYIICLEDGRRFKSLKRHLHSEHSLTPQDYRAKWNLPKDYPMVAPAYAHARSSLAKTLGLGRKTASAPAETAEIEEVESAEAEAPPPRRGRRRSSPTTEA